MNSTERENASHDEDETLLVNTSMKGARFFVHAAPPVRKRPSHHKHVRRNCAPKRDVRNVSARKRRVASSASRQHCHNLRHAAILWCENRLNSGVFAFWRAKLIFSFFRRRWSAQYTLTQRIGSLASALHDKLGVQGTFASNALLRHVPPTPPLPQTIQNLPFFFFSSRLRLRLPAFLTKSAANANKTWT